MEPTERVQALRSLPRQEAVEAFQVLDPAYQIEVIDLLDPGEARFFLDALDPDDRARLFQEMPEELEVRALAALDPRERAMTSLLLGYPEESAGRIMTPEFLYLNSAMTAAASLEAIRQRGRSAETIYTLPVTDDDRRLVGMVELKDLVLAEPDRKVGDLMETDFPKVGADDDQETVARLIQSSDALAAPVVDAGGRLVGLVTVDDAFDVLEQEGEEDLALAGGTFPLGRPYFSATVLQVARSRLVWLLVLAAAATLTVTVLKSFAAALETAIGLALFIPLLIGTGGNLGSQCVTTIMRGLAAGEIRSEDLAKVVFREVRTGVLLGAMLGSIAVAPVWLFAGADLAVTVSSTLIAICGLATLAGSAMPILAGRIGLDPAVVSAPLVTTIVDAAGLLIYFLIARAVIGA